jgi:hypothetical protein
MEKPDSPFDRTALVVFAKTLDVPVKTRIARTEGKAVAHSVYRELLDVTAASIKELPYHVAFAGNESPGMLTAIFDRALSFFPQTGDDLGARMENGFLHFSAREINRFIVIGCDCPARTEDDIVCAAQNLRKGDNVVVGPVTDGGYHLIGTDMKGLVVFDAKQWGTSGLMEETFAIIRKHGLKSTLLPMRYDIDTIEDYQRWKSAR